MKLQYRLKSLNENYNYDILFAEYTLFTYVIMASVPYIYTVNLHTEL